MKTKLKKAFSNHVKDGLNTMCNHVEKRMETYRDLYKIDKTSEKINCRNAIMKDLANKLPIGRQYMWLFSAVIIEELQGGK
tara:strand:- start:360 stop:602 length:243 start_codon:yes stop_codon:yes gene_type:complete